MTRGMNIYDELGEKGLPYGSSRNPLVVTNPGSPATLGQKSRANSSSTALSTEDAAAVSGTYRRAAAVGATAGDALFVQGVTTAGTISVTLVNGGTISVNVPLGSSILTLGVTTAPTLGTAVGATFQSLYFT